MKRLCILVIFLTFLFPRYTLAHPNEISPYSPVVRVLQDGVPVGREFVVVYQTADYGALDKPSRLTPALCGTERGCALDVSLMKSANVDPPYMIYEFPEALPADTTGFMLQTLIADNQFVLDPVYDAKSRAILLATDEKFMREHADGLSSEEIETVIRNFKTGPVQRYVIPKLEYTDFTRKIDFDVSLQQTDPAPYGLGTVSVEQFDRGGYPYDTSTEPVTELGTRTLESTLVELARSVGTLVVLFISIF